jgi:hypothetical protein
MPASLLTFENDLGLRRRRRRCAREVKAHDEGKAISLRYDARYWHPQHHLPPATCPPAPAAPVTAAPVPVSPVPVSPVPVTPVDGAVTQSVLPLAPAPPPAQEPAGRPTWTEDDDAHATANAFAGDLAAIVGDAPGDELHTGRASDGDAFLQRVRESERERASAAAHRTDEEEDDDQQPDEAPVAAPTTAHRHQIFDDLGHATRFDAGAFSVDLSSAFDAFDAQIERAKAREAEQQALRDQARRAPELGRMDLLEDIRHITQRALAATPVAGRRVADHDEQREAQEPDDDADDVGQAAALADASFDVRYTVELVPQQTGMSCWAAGAAMVVGWRDGVSVDPSEIARAAGYWAQYRDGLAAEDTTMLSTWRLVPEPAQSYTVEAFRRLAETYGPLWVASAEPGAHIRVVTGVHGDGTPDGTTVEIADPWERGMTAFRTPNAGARYAETYREFVDKQERLARSEQRIQGIYVAHAVGRPAER